MKNLGSPTTKVFGWPGRGGWFPALSRPNWNDQLLLFMAGFNLGLSVGLPRWWYLNLFAGILGAFAWTLPGRPATAQRNVQTAPHDEANQKEKHG